MDVPSDGRIPRPWVLEVLEAFAEQAAIAIVNANRHEQATARMQRLEREREALRNDIAKRQQHEADLRHQARHDPLTGLANSTELRERLADLVADGVPIAVYFCDLDLFKMVNDTFGHAIGDLVLRHVADRLRNAVRGGDIVARLGGDEFVVVAVDVGRAEAYALLDRLDQAFAHPVTVDGHPPQLVGASLGIAYDPATEHSDLVAKERAEELLSAADSKMSATKAVEGGDQPAHRAGLAQPVGPFRRFRAPPPPCPAGARREGFAAARAQPEEARAAAWAGLEVVPTARSGATCPGGA